MVKHVTTITSVRQLSLIFIALTIWLPVSSCAQIKTGNSEQHVPFVGCPSSDQGRLTPAPSRDDVAVQLDTKTARRLAYYGTKGLHVLAPRGWHCFETGGSGGFTLYVSPQTIKEGDLFNSPPWNGFTGSIIQVSSIDKGTSGRFEAARVIARVFPAQMPFVQGVINEGLWPASDFPSDPYPKDQISYRNGSIVEYQTPPNTEGLGTMSRLRKNSDPISGVILGNPTDEYLIHAVVRLPPDLNDFTSTIIQQFEQENTKGH